MEQQATGVFGVRRREHVQSTLAVIGTFAFAALVAVSLAVLLR